MPSYENFNSTGLSKSIRRLSLTFLGLTSVIFIIFLLFSVQTALTKEENKITVPIDQVVKTSKLTAEQLTKTTVTVPVSWVSESYLKAKGDSTVSTKTDTSSSNTSKNIISPHEKIEEMVDSENLPEDWESLWESDFNSQKKVGRYRYDGFATADYEDFCDQIEVVDEDVNAEITTDRSSPDSPKVIRLTANVYNKAGKFINALNHRRIDFVDNHRYIAYGYFKMGKGRDESQNNGVNLQLVDNFTEYAALFQWITNPRDNNKGWVQLRTKQGDKPLIHIGLDADWHYFELAVLYSGSEKKITKLRIDNEVKEVDYEMSTYEKDWEDSFALLLEGTNRWTHCDKSNTCKTSFLFDEVGIVKKPIDTE